MIGFVEDDGGRAASGRKGDVADCCVRAIAIITRTSYDEVYRRVADLNAEYGTPINGKQVRTASHGVNWRVRDMAFADFGQSRSSGCAPRPNRSPPSRRHTSVLATVSSRYATMCALSLEVRCRTRLTAVSMRKNGHTDLSASQKQHWSGARRHNRE